MNFWGLWNLDTEWKNQRCARMKCELSFYIKPFFSWNDNWHLLLFLSGMDWCNSVGKKTPLKDRHSLSSRNNWNWWCYSIARIWIWLAHNIATQHFMTLTVTKKCKWKVLLCNLYVDFHVRVLDMMTGWHSVRFSGVVVSKVRLAVFFPDETKSCFYGVCLTKLERQILNSENNEHRTIIATSSRNISRSKNWHFVKPLRVPSGRVQSHSSQRKVS